MKPKIDNTKFGSITIEGKSFERDVIIRMNGDIKKRKKKLSKAVYGTSHIMSVDEAEYVYEKGAELMIVGSGHYDTLKLSDEAKHYLSKNNCAVAVHATPKAIQIWNKSPKNTIALFHLTC